jgi:fibronectin type 3 domain-containing protein
MKTYLFLVTIVPLVLLCTQREDGMGTRNNPFDPGGSDWTINAPPEATVTTNSLWVDFNHTTNSGSVSLSIAADDRNFPFDTLSGTLRAAQKLYAISQTGTTYPCTVTVNDLKKGTDTCYLSLTTPSGIPPQPPVPIVSSSISGVVITWDTITGAEQYVLKVAQNRTGPFLIDETITPTDVSSGQISVSGNLGDYAPPVFYRLGSMNATGTSFYPDTLIGRAINNRLPTPAVIASKGTDPDLINLQIRFNYTSMCSYVELYRKVSGTGHFLLFATLKIPSNSSGTLLNMIHHDSTLITDSCFYRAVMIDTNERCGSPGTSDFGFLQRIAVPDRLTLVPEFDFVKLSWDSSAGAAYYRIYRSLESCSTMEELATTVTLQYSDTPPGADTYYYAVSAVDRRGRDGMKSPCVNGHIKVLPAVEKFNVSYGLYIDRIILSWKPVAGASGYIIQRDPPKEGTGIDTIGTDSTYVDTVNLPNVYSYRIAAFDERGTGLFSEYERGIVINPPIPSITVNGTSVTISWVEHPKALQYYLYRGTDTTAFTLIDSTSLLSLIDTPPELIRYFYRLVLLTAEGLTKPGSPATANYKLNPPDTLVAADRDNGVLLNWPKVRFAGSYKIYRSELSYEYIFYRDVADTQFFDTLSDDTRYYYRVAAVCDTVVSKPTLPVRAGRNSVPRPPIILNTKGFFYYIEITWTVDKGGSSSDGFYIYRSTGKSTDYRLIDSTLSQSYIDSVPDSLIYYYKISAYNAFGESGQSSGISGTRKRPSKPTNTTATNGTYADYVRISWTAVPEAAWYNIYRYTQEYGVFPYIGGTYGTEFYDTTCDANKTYYYLVASILPDEVRSPNLKSIRGARLGPPEVATINRDLESVIVTWKPHPFSVAQYYIYRSDRPTGPYTKIDSTTSTSYTDRSPPAGNNHYRISAKNMQESSLSVGYLSTEPLFPDMPETITATRGTFVKCTGISWSAPSGATGYRLYRAPTETFNHDTVLITSTPATMWNDSVASDSVFFYRVKAFNSFGESKLSEAVASGFRTPASVPAALPAPFITGEKDSIQIGWDHPSTAVGYLGYNVYRASASDGPFELLLTTEQTRFADTPPGSYPTTYRYRIAAYNRKGEGGSATITASRR